MRSSPSGHQIQLDQPQAVIDAVDEVLRQIHAGTKSSDNAALGLIPAAVPSIFARPGVDSRSCYLPSCKRTLRSATNRRTLEYVAVHLG